MSDIDISVGAPAAPDSTPSAPAVTDAPIPSASADPATDNGPSTDPFAGLDTDKIFNTPKADVGQPKESPDVPVVTDPPGSRQAAEVPEKAKGQGETPEEGKGESTDPAAVAQPDPKAESTDKKDDRSLAFNEKLNWEDDKVPFREEFANLKNAYLELLNGDPIAQFIQSPDEFRKRMAEASPTGYAEIGTLLATESAEKHPEQWINYFKEHQPDLLAKLVTGKDDMTLDRLSAELEVLLAEDEPDVQAAMEKNKAAAAEAAKSDESKKAAAETPEQKEIREWREQRDRDQITAVTTKVFQPIEDAVDSLVSQAGLEVKDADYKGKNFTELDPDTQFKVLVNEMLPVYIDWRIKQDPKLVSMQSRLDGFLSKKDETSALALQHPARIAVTNFANEFLSIVTGKKAQAVAADTVPPTSEEPKPIVRTAGAGHSPAALPDDGRPDWQVTEADLFGKG